VGWTARIAVLAVLALGLTPAWGQEPGRGRSLPAAVVRVLSGDTISVFVNGEVERVRYIGVVAPLPGEGDQSGDSQGNEALRFNRGLVSAKNVRLELDAQERDPEGRLLAYVWLGDVMANAEVVGRGYGQVVGGGPNVRYQEILLRRQQEARAARLGIWRTAGPAPPAVRGGPAAPEPRAAEGRPGLPPTNGWTCPLSHPIKGDFRTYSSERCIYYPPGTATYAESRTDRCYVSEDEARQDGCRRSRR
jgi:endonuclease YncB( thermonuclease family)